MSPDDGTPEDGATGRSEDAAGTPARPAPLTPDLEIRETRKGSKPGSRYVRVTPRSRRSFERIGEGEYQATAVAMRPRGRTEAAWQRFKRVVVGPPLATYQLIDERLSKLKALAIFSSDNLSSSAYATEEILLILVLAGTGAFSVSIPIAIAIALLVAVVALSYSQVIRGYPGGGGAYVVASENLGRTAGLIAGASLVVDYTLTVAVSVAAGVAALTSAAPALYDERVLLAVAFVALLTLANLRGLRESGNIFAAPTYFFVASFGALIVTGLVRTALGHDLSAGTPANPVEAGSQTLGLFLILRAFSSGSAALTGIEAMSNGVPSFRPPEARNANVTLAWMVAILSFFFLGMTVLAHQVDAFPSETTTIVAQVGEAVYGKTPLFYGLQVATVLILILAANTSFAGLPSLAAVMARDRALPHQFSFRGDRLAFSNGIIVLGLAAVGLLIVFQAETHALIPLYAVGVFIGFTLSQVGLVRHWHRDGSPAARRSMVVNAAGAVATGMVAVIIGATKFVDGAWITLAAIIALAAAFAWIGRHYRGVNDQLAVGAGDREAASPGEQARPSGGPAVIVPVDDLNRAVLRTLAYARSVSSNVTAVHVTDELAEGERLRERWDATVPDVPIVIVESPYRSFLGPMLAYIDAADRADPGQSITVVLPEYVPARFWQGWLHNQSAGRLKRALLRRPNTVVVDVRYHLVGGDGT